MKIGKDSVVIGNVPTDAQVGDGSVLIGATDARGNTILNQPMAVGRGAQAGPGSIAIGAFAGAGVTQRQIVEALQEDLQQYAKLVSARQDEALSREFEKLKVELQQPAPNKSAVLKAWEGVKALGNINGAHTLLVKISSGLAMLFGASGA